MQTFSFTSRERDILYAVGRAVLPAGRRFPPFQRKTVLDVEAALRRMPPPARHLFRSVLWMLEEGARTRTLRPLSELPVEKQQRYLNRWVEGSWPKRQAFRIFSTILKARYYDNPDLFQELGIEYRKPPVQDEPQRWLQLVQSGREIREDTEIEAEVVVVGSGAGGAVAAAELAERGNAVVLVEEGEFYRRSSFTGRPFEMQRLMYRNQGLTFTVGNTSILLPVGISVGGTTTVNSGTCFRTPRRTLRRWREGYGLTDFTPQMMEPYFQRVEAGYQVTRADMQQVGRIGEIIGRGAERLGYLHGPLARCAPECDGQGVCCFGCPSDAKRSTNVSYVPRALKANAHLLTGVRVRDLLLEGGRVMGVQGRSIHTKRRVTVRASVVVLACGTLFTPLLLMRHGIGNRSGRLGKHISIHPGAGVIARMDEPVEASRSIPQGYAVEEFSEEGILFEGAHLPFDMTAMVCPGIGRELQEFMEDYNHLAGFGVMVGDSSRGAVRRGTGGFPLVTYFLNRWDQERIVRGVDILTRIYLAAGARKVWTPIHGWTPILTERDLETNRKKKVCARDLDLAAYHPVGSCHMGGDRNRYVCDPYGELYDVENLFICDGSVVPPSPGVNPMITISAIATRTADYIHGRL